MLFLVLFYFELMQFFKLPSEKWFRKAIYYTVIF